MNKNTWTNLKILKETKYLKIRVLEGEGYVVTELKASAGEFILCQFTHIHVERRANPKILF